MSQITSGLRAVLSHPAVYDRLQQLLGAHAFRTDFAQHVIRARPSDRVLDLGCGTAEILAYLPAVSYVGFDISEPYITAARRRFGAAGRFETRRPDAAEWAGGDGFDIVLAIGVLHHLDDEDAADLLKTARAALKQKGRLITVDPAIVDGQSRLARYLIGKDRGQHVRRPQDYEGLASAVFGDVATTVQHRAWIPYTHCFMEAREPR